RRIRQYRSGDRDRVVAGEALDDAVGRVGDRAQFGAEFGEHVAFDPLGQLRQHAVEKFDLPVVELRSAAQEEVGDLPEDFDTTTIGAALNRGLQLVDNR